MKVLSNTCHTHRAMTSTHLCCVHLSFAGTRTQWLPSEVLFCIFPLLSHRYGALCEGHLYKFQAILPFQLGRFVGSANVEHLFVF
jgi:hypothetical protein